MTQKNTFDDIIAPAPATTKRSIRDIPVREKKPNKIDELLEETADMRAEHHTPPPVYNPPTPKMTKRKSNKGLWISIIVILVALAAGAMSVFSGATVDVTIKSENVAVNFVATSTPSIASSSVAYKIVSISKEGTKSVAATGASVKAEKKASGTIIIYNKTDKAQPLDATTRFETPEGLVYRIDKGVNIPVGGSVEAFVQADKAGDSYNVGLKDFTLPGLKGTTKFEDIYARSKTPMTGGFIGNMPQVADADLKAANAELETSLTAQALADVNAQKGAGSIFFDEAVIASYTSTVVPATASGTATVNGKVTLEALVFDQSAIEKAIADTKNGQIYKFDNLEDLKIAINKIETLDSFGGNLVLLLSFSGTLTTGNSFDEAALRNALAGKSKAQLPEILKLYPEIGSAEAVVRPVWKGSFPENPEKIKINVTK